MATDFSRNPAIPARVVDWNPIRKAYVDEAERPSFEDLSERFSIPAARISRASSDEGWPLLRARRLERAVSEGDTARALLAMAEGDRTLRDAVRSTAITAVQLVHESLEELRGQKSSTKLRNISTASFALTNVCNALKAVGIAVGTKGRGPDDGEAPGEAWVRGLAQQINLAVTVNGQKASNECPTVSAT